MFSLRHGLLLPTLITLLSLPGFAQSTSTLRGSVMDSSGAAISGATVVTRNQATGLQRTIQTNDTGNYEFFALPIGSYQVEVHAQGMQSTTVSGLVLQVSQIVVQNFQLGVAKGSEVITVSAETP